MPNDCGDSDNLESGSETESADEGWTLGVSDEQKMASITRVSFDWCSIVREIGERYRDHPFVDDIADEFDLPISKTQRAVATYYLIFAEPPVDSVRAISFENSYQYYRNGVTISELNTDSREEAENQIREYVGRVLIKEDPEAVDIDKPAPEMQYRSITGTAQNLVSESAPSAISSMVSELTNISEISDAISATIDQSSLYRQSVELSQVMDAVTHQPLQQLQETMKTYPLITGSAAITTPVIASSVLSGVDPTLQLLTQQNTQQILEATQVMSNLYTSDFSQLVEAVNKTSTYQIYGVIEEARSAVNATELAAVMGVSAARPLTDEVLEWNNLEWSPPTSESSVNVAETDGWFISPLELPSPKHLAIFYIGIADLVINQLIIMYPGYNELLYAGPMVKLVLGAYIWTKYYR